MDDAITATEAVIEQTRIVKQGLLQDLLTKGIGHTRFKQTEIGEVPEGWEVVPLRELVVENGLQTGPFGSQLHATEYTEQGVPVVMPRDLASGRVDCSAVARISESRAESLAKHRLQPGDVVFARRGDIGRSALITSRETGFVCGTGCLRARPLARINSVYLSEVLCAQPTIAWLNENAVGQTMLNLNTTILGQTPMPIPPRAEQDAIAEVLASVADTLPANEARRMQLERLKSGLLRDLLTGTVRVTP